MEVSSPTSTQEQVSSDPSAATPPVSNSPHNYAKWFGLALLLGSLGIAITHNPFPPLLVMAGYLAYGLATAKREGLVVEFSDSFYYLGFALTLLSLCVGLGAVQGVFATDVKTDILATF